MSSKIPAKFAGWNGRSRLIIAFNITSTGGNGALVVDGDDYGFIQSVTQTAIGLISVVFKERFAKMIFAGLNLIEATPAGSQVQVKTVDVSGPATSTRTVVLAVGAAGAYAAKYLVAGDKIMCEFIMSNQGSR